jgi:rhodanese-related sulfurtransferase
MTQLKTISAHDFSALCSAQPLPFVLDVRSGAECREVALAMPYEHVPLDALDPVSLRKKIGQEPVYVLRKKGMRAAHAAQQLCEEGCADVTVIEGGIDALGMTPIELKRDNGVMSLERQIRIMAGFVVLAGVILGAYLSSWFYILAGLTGAGLILSGITGWCGAAMLLAKAPWNK